MKEMVVEYNVTMILTNLGVIYNENGEEQINRNINEVKPLMGKYWEHIPNTRIIVTRDSETNKRRLMVYKSNYMVNTTETLNISEFGTS